MFFFYFSYTTAISHLLWLFNLLMDTILYFFIVQFSVTQKMQHMTEKLQSTTFLSWRRFLDIVVYRFI